MVIVMDEMYGQLSRLLASYQLPRRIAMPGSKRLIAAGLTNGDALVIFYPSDFGFFKNFMFSSLSSIGSRSSMN